MFTRAGLIAALRLPLVGLEEWISVSSARHKIDPMVLASVLAIENHARGRIGRRIETYGARILLALGRTQRVEHLSLGIGQIQPCRVPGNGSLRERIDYVLSEAQAVDLCAQILSDIRRAQQLPEEAATWTPHDWAAIGRGYGGNAIYGHALNQAHQVLRARSANSKSMSQR